MKVSAALLLATVAAASPLVKRGSAALDQVFKDIQTVGTDAQNLLVSAPDVLHKRTKR